MTRTRILVLFACALLAACGSSAQTPADACHENSDCLAGLVCALGACREPCASSADCAAGDSCTPVGDAGGSACTGPAPGSGGAGEASTSAPEASTNPVNDANLCCHIVSTDGGAGANCYGSTLYEKTSDVACGYGPTGNSVPWECDLTASGGALCGYSACTAIGAQCGWPGSPPSCVGTIEPCP
jgi:hypothetical protein